METNVQEMELNEFKNLQMNASVTGLLKALKKFMIAGWILSVIVIGLYVIMITCGLIGVQYIRRQQLKKGLLIAFLGIFTLGIWPYLEVSKLIKEDSKVNVEYNSLEFKKSLLKGYNVGLLLACVGMMTLFFIIGFFILPIAIYFIAVQHIRRDRMIYGVAMLIFGSWTLGIWPLIDCFISRSRLKREILLQEVIA